MLTAIPLLPSRFGFQHVEKGGVAIGFLNLTVPAVIGASLVGNGIADLAKHAHFALVAMAIVVLIGAITVVTYAANRFRT